MRSGSGRGEGETGAGQGPLRQKKRGLGRVFFGLLALLSLHLLPVGPVAVPTVVAPAGIAGGLALVVLG
ncbi:hypothetical protein XACJJ10_2410022 [Xanthomonas citri pv. citri]|nr:hypothetical protein XAC40_1390032 [Xanthomonas citri pv. citri]CEH83811.1 hypothetical protein XAC3612_2890004 [Xanthomonas citri pv. citri]CEI02872.1 hypothetical protein XACG117_3130021 [Xanthomonas citri pv. citri]CEI36789.1 hypothetical protein XACJJ10_2410022 [Xanthomonas citri pv. citri]